MPDISVRPKTAEELLALPIGPEFGRIEKEINGTLVRVPVMKPVCVYYVGPDDIIAVQDEDGCAWRLGAYVDGTWFRQRSYL